MTKAKKKEAGIFVTRQKYRRQLADAMALDLMTNGAGQQAEQLRLVLRDGSDGGGYDYEGLAFSIFKLLVHYGVE